MVSPAADYRPQTTLRTNITAALNIRKAVIAQPEGKQPKVVYIGSVAQMGDRRQPRLHWGRTGDPICVSPYDHYGITKAIAERILTSPQIRRWVSLRQSGILYPAILRNYDPIMFHVPIAGVLEWATVEDSGRLLERVCRDEVPDEFWNNYYNIGSGEQYRITNYRFEQLLLDAIGCPKPEKIFETRWFATRNFHGMWYIDGDKLENYLHFRANVPIEEYFERMSRSPQVPLGIRIAKYTKIAKLFPHIVKLAMRYMAYSPVHGTQWWVSRLDSADEREQRQAELRVAAYYGSKEDYDSISDWDKINKDAAKDGYLTLNHGYDEHKPLSLIDINDLKQAAAYRGGKCLNEAMPKGGLDGEADWECACTHRFKTSPRQVLLGGHWCPECFPYPYENGDIKGLEETGFPAYNRPWQWDREAKHNPFFASLWTPQHNADEDNVYSSEVFNGWEKK